MLSSDLVFKEIFGTQKNIRFLERFLEELKEYPQGTLKEKVTILNGNPLNKTNVKNKSVVSDILVSIPDEIVNIEMYTNFNEEDFTKSKVYFFRIYGSDLSIGKNYKEQHKVSQYNICLKSSLSFTKVLKTEYLLKENEKNIVVANDLKGTIYNLDKLEEQNYNVGENNLLEGMLRLIKAETDEERKDIAEGSEFLMDVVTQIRKFLYDEETREMKNLQDKWKREAEREGFAEGHEKGFKQGIEKGIKQGVEQGIEQGIVLSQRKIICNMLKEHVELKQIAKFTGYSIQQIQQIQKELS